MSMTRKIKLQIFAWSVAVGAAFLGIGLYFLKVSFGAWWMDDAMIIVLVICKAVEVWNERRR
jgi:hypothetical protein